MAAHNPIKAWAAQIRAPFLLLSVFLVLIGGAVAHAEGRLIWLRFALAMVGVVLAHVAVNLFNELSDHRTGIDDNTTRTPFSGGSGSLQAGSTTPRAVLAVASTTLLVALGIGVYLTWVAGWQLMIFVVFGGLATVFYTTHLARWMLGEIAAGVALGSFVVLGTYFAMTGSISLTVVWISVPPGILTALLLFLNEFPDMEADRQGGRHHLVIALGLRRSGVLYTVALAASYLVLVAGVLLGKLSPWVLLSLLTLPLAIRAAIGALRHAASVEKLVPAMGANVGVVLGTDLLLAVAYFIQ